MSDSQKGKPIETELNFAFVCFLASFGLACVSAFALLLLLNSFLAYCQNLLNFLVTRYTSALTLQVLGNGKGIAAAIVSVLLFRNPVTAMGIIGYIVTIIGVLAYSESKRSRGIKMDAHAHAQPLDGRL